MTGKLLTPERVASILRVSEESIVRTISARTPAAGALVGLRVEGRWMVREEDLVAFAGLNASATASEVVLIDEVAALTGLSMFVVAGAAKDGQFRAFYVGRGHAQQWRTRRVDAEAFRDKRAGRRRGDEEAAVAVAAVDVAPAEVAGDVVVSDEPRPLGRRVPDVARLLGGISERTVTGLLTEPKRKGKPKLWGFRVGKTWLVSDDELARFVDECKRVERGEEIP